MKRAILLGLLFAAIQADRQAQAQDKWISLDQKFAHYNDPQLEQVRTAIVSLDAQSVMAQNQRAGHSAAEMLTELDRRVAQASAAMRMDKDGYIAQHNPGPDVDAVFAAIDSDAPDQIPSLAINPWLKAYIKDRWLLIGSQALIRVINGESKILEGVATTATTSPTDAVSAGPRSYKVMPDDTLWHIAKLMYPNNTAQGVEKIKAANKEAFSTGKPLTAGQVLVIPD
jgi:nucleoid-associated protein YgaU